MNIQYPQDLFYVPVHKENALYASQRRRSIISQLPHACSFFAWEASSSKQSEFTLSHSNLTQLTKLCQTVLHSHSCGKYFLSPAVNEGGHHSVSLFYLSTPKPKEIRAVLSLRLLCRQPNSCRQLFSPPSVQKLSQLSKTHEKRLALFPPFLLIRIQYSLVC